jgi:translation initiation factor IF-2
VTVARIDSKSLRPRKEGGTLPIRIYALAKELKIDSKELVEICTKAGIQGKGSALASLDDAEVEKVKAFLSGGSKKSAPAPAAPATPAAAKEPLRPVTAPATPSQEPTKYTRNDYIAPAASGKIKVIAGGKPKPAAEEEPKPEAPAEPEPRPKKKREPVINLAKMPEIKQPPPKPKSKEPTPQKPEIRLPKDAIPATRRDLELRSNT